MQSYLKQNLHIKSEESTSQSYLGSRKSFNLPVGLLMPLARVFSYWVGFLSLWPEFFHTGWTCNASSQSFCVPGGLIMLLAEVFGYRNPTGAY